MKLHVYRNSQFFVWIILYSLSLIACKKYLNIPPPQTQVTNATVFSTDQVATSAMVGVYSNMMATIGLLNGYMSVFQGLSADELINNTPVAPYAEFYSNSLTSNEATVYTSWQQGYNYIYQANAVIEGLVNSPVSQPVKDQLTGEAKFVRALTYFYLVNLFSDVPLVTGTNYQTNAVLPRTPAATVYSQIIQDLKDADSLLPAAYVTTSGYPTARIRPNKWAAAALLARVYLYLKDWPDAEASASAIINSGMYQIEANLNNVFLSTSTEAIWQLLPVGINANSAEGSSFLTLFSFQSPAFNLTPTLLNSFEANDLRRVDWVQTRATGSTVYIYPYKYKIASGSPPVEYNNVLRYAEQFLIRSEARAQQGNVSGSQADLNVVRARAGLPNTTATSPDSLILALQHENEIEFFAEWGHRWFDLKRSGDIDAVLSAEKTSWQPKDSLWPIPFPELQLNPYLTQNSGY